MTRTAPRLDFRRFHAGTLFLIRTPETFPEGYAEKSFRDMKENLHLDYAAWLETWNCADGIIWRHPDYPRSSYWQGCDRDPLEETFCAADRADMAFLPECGVIHESFAASHAGAKRRLYSGQICRYGRVGLVPAAPVTADFLIAKYDALIGKFGHHPSFRAICMPAENCVQISYDNYTLSAWKKCFSTAFPSPSELAGAPGLQKRVNSFLENLFLAMYRKLARHLKQKYALPLMHYPVSQVSWVSHHVPGGTWPGKNLELINQVEEIDLLNLQLHPPLGNHPRQFKLEMELLEGNTAKACVADTHWYHETNAGKRPGLDEETAIDWILSTLTPFGISFFCYGFMAEELPLWQKELNPGTPVFHCYQGQSAERRRSAAIRLGMAYARLIGKYLNGKKHYAEAALFYRESLDDDYRFGSYCREHLFSFYESVQAAAIPLGVTGTIPEECSRIRCLIFDAVKSFSPEDAAALKKFLASGGKAVVIGKCAESLYDVCGFTVRECAADYVTAGASPHDPLAFSLPVDAKKLTAEGKVIRAYDRGDGAVVQSADAVFLGCWSAVSDFENKRQQGVVQLWKELFALLNAESGIRFFPDHARFKGGHEYASCDLYADPDGTERVLLIRNFGVEIPSSRLETGLPAGFRSGQFIVDGRHEPFPEDGWLPEIGHFALLTWEKTKPI